MKVVCFGDSLTACGGEQGRFSDILRDRFPSHTFVNAGVGGETIAEGLERLEPDVLAGRPDVVLIEFGANDWWRNERPPRDWAADLEQMVSRIRDVGAQPVILGVFGPYVEASGQRVEKQYGIDEHALLFRTLEEDLATRHGCPYLANIQEHIIGRRCCWRDANHPNEMGNRHVADCVEPVLVELLGDPPRPLRKPTLQTTRDFWLEAVELAPEQPAVADGARRLTYRLADGFVRRIAAGLAHVTGKDRPVVAVSLPNGLEYYLLYWAVVRLGGVIVPLSPWLKRENLVGIFSNICPDVVVVHSEKDADVLAVSRDAGVACCVALDPAGSELTPWLELAESTFPVPATSLDPDDVSIVMHTSGTTGTPKGAMMRHSDLMFNVTTTINAHQFGVNDVHLLVNPMFHCTALYSSLPTAAYTKTPVIIAAPSNPRVLLELVEREHITTFLSVPSVFQQLLKVAELNRFDTSSLRVLAYAGSPMPVRTIEALQAHFPDVALHNFFGLTETISMTHVMNAEDAEGRMDSIGRLLPFVEARVVDEDGETLPAGDVGELLFARENVIPGYVNQPGKLDEAFMTIGERVWFRTGDLACVDEDGFFFIRGRKKDMIIVAGENVYATEVESVLLSHRQVTEAAVKGVPATGAATFLGEEVHAYVVRAEKGLKEADLRRYCYEKLPSFKVPRKIVFMDALPRNPAGKVMKQELGP